MQSKSFLASGMDMSTIGMVYDAPALLIRMSILGIDAAHWSMVCCDCMASVMVLMPSAERLAIFD